MSLLEVKSFAAGEWIAPDANARAIENAVTGEQLGRAGNDALDVQGILDYARQTGGPRASRTDIPRPRPACSRRCRLN